MEILALRNEHLASVISFRVNVCDATSKTYRLCPSNSVLGHRRHRFRPGETRWWARR